MKLIKYILTVCLSVLLSKNMFAADTLSGTAPLEWVEDDLSARLMDGAHRFVERKIEESVKKRALFWSRDFSSPQAYERSVETNRDHFKKIIGIADPRLPALLERYGDDENPVVVADTSRYTVEQVRWRVLNGVWGYGLLVQPKTKPLACAVVIPDADQYPEQLVGLIPGVPVNSQAARRLAENGFVLLIPQTVRRDKLQTDDPQIRSSDQTYREWIYRQAFHLGRHIIGYEVQTSMAAIDWIRKKFGADIKIGICGYNEGGLVAFYCAAADTRVDAALVSGYFNSRQRVWSEPIYRNVWSLLQQFGDAEIAGLILPRSLIIEHSPIPAITGHKGDLKTPDFEDVRLEAERVETGGIFKKPSLIRSDDKYYSDGALSEFARNLGVNKILELSDEIPLDPRKQFNPAIRHSNYFTELENHAQRLIAKSDFVRDDFFLYAIMPELRITKWSTDSHLPTYSLEKFVQGSKRYRQIFKDEAIGCFDEQLLPFNARSRRIAVNDKWTAYDVVLDIYPEFFAWGMLVLPNDLKPGEKRPVVVCQHGRNGIPRHLLEGNRDGYNDIAAKLAARGFIVFAPHNLYRGEDRYRWLDRKANTIKATLFSFIVVSHEQILRWLETLPFVDANRIAFYGLSYGGETAMRVPAIVEKYCLSICSGDFNQWTRKVASTDQPFSYMRTIEWEMPYWNLGNTFDYAEMAYLILPRPLMVERGHRDLVGRDQWVAYEYAKVRWLYAQLGIADRTRIEFFQGGHSMRAEGTLDFLHQYLNWKISNSSQ